MVDSRCVQSSDKQQSRHHHARPLPSLERTYTCQHFLPSQPPRLCSLSDRSPHLRLRCSLDQPSCQRCNSRAEQDSTLAQLWGNSTLSDRISKYCFRSRSLCRHSGQTTLPTSLCEEIPGNRVGHFLLFRDLSLAKRRRV